MRSKGTVLLLLCALVAAAISVFGGDNYSRLKSVRENLAAQRKKNAELERYVDSVRHEEYGLQNDERVLDKAARNELGMAHADEVLVFFDDENGTDAIVGDVDRATAPKLSPSKPSSVKSNVARASLGRGDSSKKSASNKSASEKITSKKLLRKT